MGDKHFKKYTSFVFKVYFKYTTFRHLKSILKVYLNESILEVYLIGSILQIYLKYT